MKLLAGLVCGALVVGSGADTSCKGVKASHGTVCECTTAYCDTVPSIPDDVHSNEAVMFQTSKAGDRLTMSRHTLEEKSGGGVGRLKIDLDVGTTYQEIVGFGGAFTDAAAINFAALEPELQDVMLEAYFGETGLGYTVGRVPIASCDFSTDDYMYAEQVDDFELASFNIDRDYETKLPFLKRALAMTKRPLSLFASPWSAPAWLKDNNSTVGGALKGVAGGREHQTWAQYFVRFLDAYEAEGVKFWAVTMQNEPNAAVRWQSMKWTAETQRDFLKLDLGPAMSAAHPDVSIMICDDQQTSLPHWADTVMADADAAKFVDGVAFHWYANVDGYIPNYPRLTKVHNAHPDTFLMPTEACEGSMPWAAGPNPGDWGRGARYAYDIIQDLENFAVGWTDWNLMLDSSGGPNWVQNVVDAPLLLPEGSVDATPGSVTSFLKNPMYYTLGHFSKYITPGSRRIAHTTSGFGTLMYSTSFITPDNHVVVVLLNDNIWSRSVSVHCPNGYVNVDIPASAIQTIVCGGVSGGQQQQQ